MLQSHVPELAGRAAQRFVWLVRRTVESVVFCNSGSEGVEIVYKIYKGAY